ncbi:sigma-54-dependent transcriptional regulator [Acinetobacter radioresistens]|jgi:two-component system response regulator PilR (NtrC family)|uniref:sigma-54-dependent transcriptional regulator n=1 Tax=Acinetobacter radioresistens TaxID=40216 RepID=UPI000277C3B9|nr:sigma-54 dependent transcriptional regulator [Acinetobacter radioresistens]EJO36201.1 sigma-54 interaction domain protein [Acinetobacter radioresistens WC-A-157]MCX0340349.1 sigma-54 dependent transcriptional regulator [Acinetobacter radioresistens]MDK8756397.1 sigma-54 dependent transcriptional regulator [Acinetobacter radioresistens]PKH33127.1 sigma-54-dependent Fis family transcriptional regulator [Acinetobacter radioresistens]QCS11147.1 sigma-54-dependent Fis family transcriptional regu
MTNQQALILLVDDEEDLCTLMQMSLAKINIRTHIAHGLEQAKKLFQQHAYDACLTDLNLPDGNGLELVQYVSQLYPCTPIAVLTAYGNMEIAISALKAGAFDFVSKPVNQAHLQQLVQKALNTPQSAQQLVQDALENRMLIGTSLPIQQLKIALKKIARSQAPVFITGESGTGKEVVANLVHRLSNRSDGPFIAINCGAIPGDLMESELFGHKKGSFTGASQDKQGLIYSAHGGSLFLDEIAELPLAMQVKLLRAVQEKKIRPIGSDQEIDVDFRVISASHQDLEILVQQGKFRQDLFFRIHVMDIVLPPLREREDDILLLAKHFIQEVCKEWDIPNKILTERGQQFLMQQYFPGNVRELRNIIERAITLSDNEYIDLPQLQSAPLRNVQNFVAGQINHEPLTDQVIPLSPHRKIPAEGLEQYLENIEKEVLLTALNQTHWNRTLAAKKLGMSFRSLRYRLKKFGLDTDDE